jgi:hypothetical protein
VADDTDALTLTKDWLMPLPSSERLPWTSWLVPPLLVPLLLIVLVVVYAVYRSAAL